MSYKKGKKQYVFENKVIIGGAFAEIKIDEKEKEDKDKLKNFSIIKTKTSENKISDDKLQKFINLKLN
jgi:hypothetical protein